MDSTAVSMAVEHANRFLMLVESLIHLKQSLSLAWFIGNIGTIFLLIYGITLFKLANKKIKRDKENKILNKISWIIYYLSSVLISISIIRKVESNGVIIGAAFLLFSIVIGMIFKKRASIIKRINSHGKIKNILSIFGMLTSAIIVIITKSQYGMWPALALLLTIVFIGFIVIKWEMLFKRTEEKRLPYGWLIILIMFTVVHMVVFNTFPGLLVEDDFKGAIINAVNTETIKNLENSYTSDLN